MRVKVDSSNRTSSIGLLSNDSESIVQGRYAMTVSHFWNSTNDLPNPRVYNVNLSNFFLMFVVAYDGQLHLYRITTSTLTFIAKKMRRSNVDNTGERIQLYSETSNSPSGGHMKIDNVGSLTYVGAPESIDSVFSAFKSLIVDMVREPDDMFEVLDTLELISTHGPQLTPL